MVKSFITLAQVIVPHWSLMIPFYRSGLMEAWPWERPLPADSLKPWSTSSTCTISHRHLIYWNALSVFVPADSAIPWHAQCDLNNNSIHCIDIYMEYWRGKYHCTIDLLFDWFGISCMTTDIFCFIFAKQTDPNQSNRRSTVQWYFPL